jgi:hypothetical protein
MEEESVKFHHHPFNSHVHQPVSVAAEDIRKAFWNENPAGGTPAGWILPDDCFAITQTKCFRDPEIQVCVISAQLPDILVRGSRGWLEEKVKNDIRGLGGGAFSQKWLKVIRDSNFSG